MSDPCRFQDQILNNVQETARQGQAISSMADDIKILTNLVSEIASKMNSMRGFIAGAAAVGGAIVAFILWIVKFIPIAFNSVMR